MIPWNAFASNHEPIVVPAPFEAGLRTWEEVIQAQQHYWNEWLEAGQLWTSWWVSALPPMPWLPTGPVMPAV